jgi:uncharacterized protein (TIGR02598 family)
MSLLPKSKYLHFKLTFMKPPNLPHALLERRYGFSLVEVCLAIGIVSFSLLALLALVPNGLQTLQNAAIEASLSAIRKEVRSEMNTANFANLSESLPLQLWYFDQSGRRLPASAPETDRFFQLRFMASEPAITGQVGGFESSAKRMMLKVTFPAFAPPSSQSTNIFTLLVARQSSQ